MNRKILPYAIVVLFAYVGFALPLPILPEMFLDPERSIISGFSLKEKMILLGCMMTSYPLGQFFGSPIIGHLSDIYGRKKIILYSLTGTTLGYILTAISTSQRYLWGMFLGLAFCGFCEGNVTIGQSVVADVADHPDHKARHFGQLNAFISLGFILGPLIGGQLADPTVVSWFTFATPFWAAACMTLIGIGIIFFTSKETLQNKKPRSWKFLGSVLDGFKNPKLPKIYIANFFLALGYFSFFRFLPVFLEQRFNFSASSLSFVMVYCSLSIMAGVLCLIPWLSRKLSVTSALALFSFLLTLVMIGCLLPSSSNALWITIPLTGLCLSVTITNGSLLVSNIASPTFQGQALGTLTSVQVLAEALTGVFGGFVASKVEGLPLYIGACMSFVCALILIIGKQRGKSYV